VIVYIVGEAYYWAKGKVGAAIVVLKSQIEAGRGSLREAV